MTYLKCSNFTFAWRSLSIMREGQGCQLSPSRILAMSSVKPGNLLLQAESTVLGLLWSSVWPCRIKEATHLWHDLIQNSSLCHCIWVEHENGWVMILRWYGLEYLHRLHRHYHGLNQLDELVVVVKETLLKKKEEKKTTYWFIKIQLLCTRLVVLLFKGNSRKILYVFRETSL